MNENHTLESLVDVSNQPKDTLSLWMRIVRVVLLPIFYIYLLSTTISIPYFNWCYARDHGFVSWLFIGEIVPTFQAVIWPYYVLSGSSEPDWSSTERDNLEHFYRSLNVSQQAVQIVYVDRQEHPSIEELVAFVALQKIALTEARKVNTNILAKAHPELPSRFREYYLRYLELINQYHDYARKDRSDSLEVAEKTYDEWAKWFNDNSTNIHLPKHRSR